MNRHDADNRNLVRTTAAAPVAAVYASIEEADDLDLARYCRALWKSKWLVVGGVLVAMAGVFGCLRMIAPQYSSSAILEIDWQVPRAVLGADTQMVAPADADEFINTQLRLLTSDAVLRPVLAKAKITPEEMHSSSSADDLIRLKHLTVSRAPNSYLIEVAYLSSDSRKSAKVANLVAESYLDYTTRLKADSLTAQTTFMEKQLDGLRLRMTESSASLARYEKELNVVNPEERLNVQSARLMQLNTELTAAQADRLRKESAVRTLEGNDALETASASTQGVSLQALRLRLDEASEKFAQIREQFGPNHQEYRKAAAQIAQLQKQVEQGSQGVRTRVGAEYSQAMKREEMLRHAVAVAKAEVDSLNMRSVEYQNVRREAESDKKLYDELARKVKEAGINAGFRNCNVRLVDAARPSNEVVYPKPKLAVGLAGLFMACCCVGGVLIRERFSPRMHTPTEARRLPAFLLGALPEVKAGKNSDHQYLRVAADQSAAPLALHSSGVYDDAIRTLHTTLLLGGPASQMRTLMISSSGPAEGKTWTAIHLARMHAESGKRALLIDADLRRPSVCRELGLPNGTGLSEALCGKAEWRDCVVPLSNMAVSVLPAGAALSGSWSAVADKFATILREASGEYDLVVIDTPPVLGLAEPLQIAAEVDGVLVVIRSGSTTSEYAELALRALRHVNASVLGVVLNRIPATMAQKYYAGIYSRSDV